MLPNRHKIKAWFLLGLGLLLSIDQIQEGIYYGLNGHAIEYSTRFWLWKQFPFLSNLGGVCILTSVFLFIIIKDKIDDEYKQHLRHKSLVIVFIITMLIGVFYGEGFNIKLDLDLTVIVFFQLLFYLIFFEILKRFNFAK